MFERFTDRARRIVVLAQDSARSLNHSYIDTQHVALALLEHGEGLAHETLSEMTNDLGSIEAKLLDLRPLGETVVSGHIPFTSDARKVLEYALRSSIEMKVNYIGVEHLLLGLMKLSGCEATKIIVEAVDDIPTADDASYNTRYDRAYERVFDHILSEKGISRESLMSTPKS